MKSRTKSNVKNNFQRWTSADDKMLLDITLSSKKLAKMLGRTEKAVAIRRLNMGLSSATTLSARAKKAWATRRANEKTVKTTVVQSNKTTTNTPQGTKDLKFIINGVDVSISKSVTKVFVAKQHIAIDF